MAILEYAPDDALLPVDTVLALKMVQTGRKWGDGLAGTRPVLERWAHAPSFCTTRLITTPAASRPASEYIDDPLAVFDIIPVQPG